MTIYYVNTGSSPNKGDGDSLRLAFTKINNNFQQLSSLVGDIDTIEDVVGDILAHSSQTGVSITYNSSTNLLSVAVTAATTTTIGGIIVGDNLSVDSNGVLSGINSYVLPYASTTEIGGVQVGGGLTVSPTGLLSANFGDIVITSSTISTLYPDEDIILSPGNSTSTSRVRIVNHGLQFDDGNGDSYHGHLIYTNPISTAGIGISDTNHSIRVVGDKITLGLIADFGLYNAIRSTWNSLINMDYQGNLNMMHGDVVFGENNKGIQFFDGSRLTSATSITAGDTPPAVAYSGSTWYDSVSGRLYIYYDSTWVDASPSGGGGGGGTSDRLVNGVHAVVLDADGKLTFPNGDLTIGNNGGANVIMAATDTSVAVIGQGIGGYVGFEWISDTTTSTTNVAAVILNSPFSATSGTVQIATGLVSGPTAEHIWEFGNDGKLTFPNGMVIDPTTFNNQTTFWGGGDTSTNGISLTTGEITNSVIIPGTVFADATGVGNTDPLGLSGKNGVSIISGADGLGHTQHNWTFGTDGTLTAPGHLLPNADLAYDLGSTTTQWRSIYVGTGTIFIGGVALGVNQDNYVTVDGNPIITVNTAGNLTVQGDVVIGTVTVSETAPTASTGTQWFNTVDGRTYIAYNGQWLDASPVVVPSPGTYLGDIAIDGSTLNINGGTLTIDDAGTLLVNGSEVTGSGTSSSTHIEYTDGQSGYTSTVDLGYNFEVDVDEAHLNINGDGTWSIGSNNFDTKIFSTIDPGNDPTVIVVRAGLDDWTFGPLGWFTLPGGSVISDTMGPIRLEPAGASSATQALLIYPTVQDGNHIHLTAGGGETDLYLGNDSQYVKVDHSGDIVVGTLGANTSTWTFGTDGILTLPAATPVIKGGGTGTDVTIIASTGSNTSTWVFAADGTLTFPDTTVQTTAYTGITTVAKTGVILPTTTGIPLTLSGGMTGLVGTVYDVVTNGGGYGAWKATDDTAGNAYLVFPQPAGSTAVTSLLAVGDSVSIEWAGQQHATTIAGALGAVPNDPYLATFPNSQGYLLTDNFGLTGQPDYNVGSVTIIKGTYGPFTRGGVTFSVTVAGGGISGYINISSTTPYAVNASPGTLTSEDLGDPPGQTTNINVESVVQETPTALDLTKSINKLTSGVYTLADGVEGQIMYLVRQTGSVYNSIIVNVANACIDGILYTTIEYYPFDSGNFPALNMSTLIFTDGAWQADSGSWD